MPDQQDLKEISHLMKVIIESEINPKLKMLSEGQELRETLAPKAGVLPPQIRDPPPRRGDRAAVKAN